MNQTQLFEPPFIRPPLPAIYIYDNLNINRKINYKSAPCNLYGACRNKIMYAVCRDFQWDSPYGLKRGYLDYSLEPNPDYRSGY